MGIESLSLFRLGWSLCSLSSSFQAVGLKKIASLGGGEIY